MLDLGEIGYKTKIDDRQYLKALQRMERDAEGTGQSIGRSLAAAFSIYSGYRFVKNLVMTASNLNEAENKFRVVFRSIGAEAQGMRETLGKEFGRSRLESAQLLGDTGDILTGFGFAQSQALKLAMEAATLGTDLASFTNYMGGAKGATEALTAAMLGETEKAKALGIVIRQDSEEFIGLVEQYQKAEHMTLLQAKAMAALTIAKRQSINATGDYARTQEEFANQSRRVGETIKDQAAALGEHLIPMISQGLRLVEAIARAIGKIPGPVIAATGYFAAWIGTMMGVKKAAELMGALNRAVLASAAKAVAAKAVDTAATTANTVATGANAAAKGTAAVATEANAVAAGVNTVATGVDTAATGADTVATTFLGKAKLFAAAACKTLWAAMVLNPFTAVAIGIMFVVSGLKALSNWSKKMTQEQLAEAQQERQAASDRLAAGDKQRMADQERMNRLHRLAKAERLSNDEMAEAKELVGELRSRHQGLGIELDGNSRRLTIQAGAQAKLNELMKKQRDFEVKSEMASIRTELGIRENRINDALDADPIFAEEEKQKQLQEDADEIIKLRERLLLMEEILKTESLIAGEQEKTAADAKLKLMHDQEWEWTEDRLDSYDLELMAMQTKVDKQKEYLDELEREDKLKPWMAAQARRFADDQLEVTRQRIAEERRLADEQKASSEQSAKDEERRNLLRIRLLQDGKLSPKDETDMARLDVQLEREKAQRARAAQVEADKRVGAAKGAVDQAKGASVFSTIAGAMGLPGVADRFQGMAVKQDTAEAELKRAEEASAAARRIATEAQAGFLGSMAELRKRQEDQSGSRRDVSREVERSGGFLATRLGLLVSNDPAKQTAQHTKEIARWTKETAKRAKDVPRFT